MPDMGPYMAEKYTKMIEGITNDLGRTADKLALAQNILRALKNPDMLVDGAPLTLERLQVMENGDIRTLPPPPEMTSHRGSHQGVRQAQRQEDRDCYGRIGGGC